VATGIGLTVGLSVPEPGIVTKTDEIPMMVVVVVGSSDRETLPSEVGRVAMEELLGKVVLGNGGFSEIGVLGLGSEI
jgi:hypothetical protein